MSRLEENELDSNNRAKTLSQPRESLQSEVIIAASRSERFVDTSQEQVLKSGNLNELISFYQGDLVHERMSAVRKSIYDIRSNWSKFDQYMENLKQFMERESCASGGLSETVKKIFERRRNWADLQENVTENFSSLKEEFNILHAYTSKEGFKEIFKVSNDIFRTDSSVKYHDHITNAAFLVELINIDLFNYVKKVPQHQNFSSIVYRGMAIPPEQFVIFESLMKQPINKRYISIPLGLWSASTSYPQAISFVGDTLKIYPRNVPLLMKIHVLNVQADYLEFYCQKFQERSVVSTICAVPISDISEYPEELEVLLRGGFYHALRFYRENIKGIDYKILELVMLNTNRDHLSTSTMLKAGEDAEARTLFGTMVGVTRNRFIVDYCRGNDLHEDLEEYVKILAEGELKLKKLMSI